MESPQMVRIYEGESFRLTDEQARAIRPALDALAANQDEGALGVLLAQVWEVEDGVFCCCHFVSHAKASIVKEVLNRDVVAIHYGKADARERA